MLRKCLDIGDRNMAENSLEPQFYESFKEIHGMIQSARRKADHQANKLLIGLYWSIGRYVSDKINSAIWGEGVVGTLSAYLISHEPGIRGFSARNIWRMKQFYEAYKDKEKLPTVLAEITWSNHIHILSKTKTEEERQFYLELGSKRPYPARDFERIIDSGMFERTMLANKKLPTLLAEFPISAKNMFKDIYLFEFTGASDDDKELTLKSLLLKHLKKFLMEMGPDFSFIGEEYVVQVGNKDYKIDLLLFNRTLNNLIAVELKVTDFKPEHLGKLQFYLEALDRDVKKPHENPSIGLLICKTKNEEVVQYAMSRSTSPAMIAEYETKLIDKALLQQKMQELSETLSDDEQWALESQREEAEDNQ